MASPWTLAWLLFALSLIAAAWCWSRLGLRARTTYAVFIAAYVGTTAIGAVLIATPTGFALWSLMFQGIDSEWLAPGETPRYWLLLTLPILVVSLLMPVLSRASDRLLRPAMSSLQADTSLTSIAIVAAVMVAFCLFNVIRGGYLGISLLASNLTGDYQTNIVLRTEMAGALGMPHFACLYAGLPALISLLTYKAVKERSAYAMTLLMALIGITVVLLLSTLTKSNILILMLGLVVSLVALRVMRGVGVILAFVFGVALLGVLESLLSGASPADLALSLGNVVFRVAASFPFYVGVFPEQLDYLGIDFGLTFLGFAPRGVPTQEIMNYMYPELTWIQGTASAPVSVAAYAQAGWAWSIAACAAAAFVLSIGTTIGERARSASAFACYIGFCVSAYYFTQSDLVGTLIHSYGLLWWLLAIVAVRVLDGVLREVSK